MRGNNQFTAQWTQEEDEWLRQHYSTSLKDEVCRAFPGRTYNSVKHRASRLGIKKAPETIAVANSITNSGRIRTPENRANISRSLTGMVQSEETKRKRSATHKRIARFGPANENWKGNDITEDQSRWRARRMIPPGPCAHCENPGVKVHHRDGHPLNNSPANLIRLCQKHHQQEHARMKREQKAGDEAV
jgi:5-methylcytosine-specific restriction endonuclease McrA